MNTAIQLDIPKERVRSVLSSYYMSTLPCEYRPADHVSFPQEDLELARHILQSEDFDTSGVFERPEPRPADAKFREAADGRQKLRRINSGETLRVLIVRFILNYCQRFMDFRFVLQTQ